MVKIIKLAWNEFIYGGHLLSLGAVSFIFTSALLLGAKITWDCLVVVYLGVHSAYLYNRYKDYYKDYLTNPKRTNYLKKGVNKIPFIIVSFFVLIILILFFYSEPAVIFFGLFLLVVSLSYSCSKGLKNITRKIPGFKNLFVSLIWSSLPLFLVLYYSLPINLALILVIIFLFLRFFINTSSFDIKDIQSDKKEGLLTLAIVLGKKKLIKLLILLNFLSLFFLIIGIYFDHFPLYSIPLIIFSGFYALFFLRAIKENKINQDFLYNVIIDAEFFLWLGFILLGKILI
jgi:4-hydroxybenzoate polyprenyltransferase